MLTAIVDGHGRAPPTAARRPSSGFRAYFRWVAEDHAAFMLLYGSGVAPRRGVQPGRAPGHGRRWPQAIAPLIAADIDDEHRLTLAHALVGLAEGASRRLVERGDDFDPDEVARQVSDLAWAGLRGVRRSTDRSRPSARRRRRAPLARRVRIPPMRISATGTSRPR